MILQTAAGRKEEFFLFGTIFAVSMIDASVGDKPILFEFSVGEYSIKDELCFCENEAFSDK